MVVFRFTFSLAFSEGRFPPESVMSLCNLPRPMSVVSGAVPTKATLCSRSSCSGAVAASHASYVAVTPRRAASSASAAALSSATYGNTSSARSSLAV